MKIWSGFIALFGIAMVINAVEGKWAFHRATTGAVYVVLDAVIAAVASSRRMCYGDVRPIGSFSKGSG